MDDREYATVYMLFSMDNPGQWRVFTADKPWDDDSRWRRVRIPVPPEIAKELVVAEVEAPPRGERG